MRETLRVSGGDEERARDVHTDVYTERFVHTWAVSLPEEVPMPRTRAPENVGDHGRSPSGMFTLVPPASAETAERAEARPEALPLGARSFVAPRGARRETLPWVNGDQRDGAWGGQRGVENIPETLASLRDVDGFLAAALVDSDEAALLGAEGGGVIDLQVAAVGNTEVVRAKRRVTVALGLLDEIEDILVTLGRQYHLIRPLRRRPSTFFYLALDRDPANLAMARMRLGMAEGLLLF